MTFNLTLRLSEFGRGRERPEAGNRMLLKQE